MHTALYTWSIHIVEITNLKLQTAIKHSVDVTWLLGLMEMFYVGIYYHMQWCVLC